MRVLAAKWWFDKINGHESTFPFYFILYALRPKIIHFCFSIFSILITNWIITSVHVYKENRSNSKVNILLIFMNLQFTQKTSAINP